MTALPVPPHVHVSHPWLTVDLGAPHRIAGWPVVGPALATARTVTWLQVQDSELPCAVDPDAFLLHRARADGVPAEVGLLTAADIQAYRMARHGGAVAIVTAGLGNGESVLPSQGAEPSRPHRVGTVNVLAVAPVPLSPHGLLEALSIVAEARTTAILDLCLRTGDGRPVTGTGTDCIVVACPLASATLDHCGLHTAWGRALAAAAYQAGWDACAHWLDRFG